jgi:hypothetical protein
MKNPKDTAPDIDRMRAWSPQLQHLVANGDCFGVEWSGTDPICSTCSVYLMCAAMYGKTGLEAKRQEVKQQFNNGGAYLDEADFSKINRQAVATIIANLAKQAKPMSYEELVTNVMKSANVTNRDVSVAYCAVLMAEFGISNNNGYLYVV